MTAKQQQWEPDMPMFAEDLAAYFHGRRSIRACQRDLATAVWPTWVVGKRRYTFVGYLNGSANVENVTPILRQKSS